MPNRISCPYQLDEFSCWVVNFIRILKIHSALSDLVLHCLSMYHKMEARQISFKLGQKLLHSESRVRAISPKRQE